uniref:Uncharacterized protein n=1 Tax=Candidatus Kentrum sp. LPFa TaxID=2126335 RepID=A0A450X461_9GAMM|nr:MAG: hypothetical protein BECKLPF1236A_GA0070988_104005 [Candidatus Kentron sp. LPFa]VFK35694.1 MAG: hypothetical protein BECKLPF1236C_GA0070990_104095 [Candidatus Kentron sp. LPFa]
MEYLFDYPENLRQNDQKFLVCHFSLREKSSALIKIPSAQDLSLRSR